jgi:hypothetical protein
VRERRAEGRRASESSAPKSLLMEHAGSRLEAAVASCNRSRPWSGRSNLSRDSPWVGAGVTTSGMRRESRWGSVISSNGMAILHGDSAGRFRFAKKRKTARRRAPLRPTTGGKKRRVHRRRGPLLADPSAGRMAAEVEDAVEAWRTDGVTPIGRGASRVAGIAPARTTVLRDLLETSAAFRVPGSRAGEGRRGISMKGIPDRGSRAEPSREARWKRSWFANADVKNRCSRDDGISEEPLSQRLDR